MLRVPGHADDHLVFVAGRAAFTGDAVLGEGSVFVSAGACASTSTGCAGCARWSWSASTPGHGDEVTDPAAKLDEYLAHRAERERKLLAALEAGAEGEDALLDAAWADAPAAVRPFAAVTLRAHLEKLREEGAAHRALVRVGARSRPSSSAACSGVRAGRGGAVEDRAQRVADGADAGVGAARARSPRARARRRC